MPTPGQHTSGPANSYAGVHGPNYPGASAFFRAPPKYTPHKSKRVVTEWISRISNVDERRPLLSLPKRDRQPDATCSYLLVILCIIFLLCPLLYFIIPGPSDAVDYKSLYEGATAHIRRLDAQNLAMKKEVALYKDMYEDVRVRSVHLAQENAALEGEIHGLQTKLHDLRGQLTNCKVLSFWEIARTMNTNMYVLRSPSLTLLMARLRDIWVGADDPGGDPKFWSYGITNGLFNDNDPPVTSTKHHFTLSETVIIESTDHRRIVGYKVESNRWNNGWWFATGLIEFGQSGSHEVKFSAKQSISGAEYEVTVYYADWKL